MSEPIDTDNLEAVGLRGDDIVILRRGIRLSRDQALNLAAWLVALADHDGRFADVLERVQNT